MTTDLQTALSIIVAGFLAVTCFPALSGAFLAFAVGGVLGLVLGIICTGWVLARSFRKVNRFLGESGLLSRLLFPPQQPPQQPPITKPVVEEVEHCFFCGQGADLDFVDKNGERWHRKCFDDSGCFVCHWGVPDNNLKCTTRSGPAHQSCYQVWCRAEIEKAAAKAHSVCIDPQYVTELMAVLNTDGTLPFLQKMKDMVKQNCPNWGRTSLLRMCQCQHWRELINLQLAKRQASCC